MLVERLMEAFNLANRNRRIFLIHCFANVFAAFQMTFVFFLYPHLICTSNIPSGKVFWLYLVFTSTIFLGSSLSQPLSKWFDPPRLLFIAISASSSALWLLTKWDHILIVVFVFFLVGLSTGLIFASSTHSFLHCFPQANFCLTHTLYLSQAIGSLLAVCQFDVNISPKTTCPHIDSHHLHSVIGQNRFAIASVLRFDLACFFGATLQMPLLYLLQTTSSAPEPSENQRETYEDMEPEPSKLPGLKLVLLTALFACTATVLSVVFPFLVFSHPQGSISHCQIFAAFFVLGRLASIFTSDKVAPFFFLAISIIGMGVACCAFVFDAPLPIGSALFGFFLSPTLPSLIAYQRFSLLLKLDTLYLLLSGSSFGHLLFPLFLCFSAPSENRVLIAFIFFATLLLVLLYVCMMNVQAQVERIKPTQDRLKMFITRFFSGENLLKRTRSIRPLISRLRPNSYKRFKERRAQRRAEQAGHPIPKIEVTIEDKVQEIDC